MFHLSCKRIVAAKFCGYWKINGNHVLCIMLTPTNNLTWAEMIKTVSFRYIFQINCIRYTGYYWEYLVFFFLQSIFLGWICQFWCFHEATLETIPSIEDIDVDKRVSMRTTFMKRKIATKDDRVLIFFTSINPIHVFNLIRKKSIFRKRERIHNRCAPIWPLFIVEINRLRTYMKNIFIPTMIIDL